MSRRITVCARWSGSNNLRGFQSGERFSLRTQRGQRNWLLSRGLLLPDPVEAVAAGKPGLNRASVAEPGISAAEALVSAMKDLGENVRPELVLPRVGTSTVAQRSHRLKAAGIRGEADARLVWLPLDRHRLQLCWQIILTPGSTGGMDRFLVDARTGRVWVRHCLTRHLEPASYRVYTSDSPSPFTPGHAAPSAEQPALGARVLLTLSGLSTNASPNSWIPDGANETRGNNVDAHLDRDADDEPDLPRPHGSPWRVFDFPLDLARDPKSYSEASTVELFYWCNWMHDRLYAMGFTEAAGNLQADNFGRGGLGDDALEADGQDGGGSDNAMISVPPDGIAPRMEMFLYYGPDPARDSDLDTEVVWSVVNFEIPSGQAIARRMGVPALTPAQLDMLEPFDMERSTPLWFYILKEAEIMEKGLRLGPVGGRIVGEVFIGLLKADDTSYLAAQPRWTPVLPSATPGDFRITDLLNFAGVVPPLN